MTAVSGAHATTTRGFIEFALAAGVVLLSVIVTEQFSKGAAWGLVILVMMGVFVTHPGTLQTLVNAVSGG